MASWDAYRTAGRCLSWCGLVILLTCIWDFSKSTHKYIHTHKSATEQIPDKEQMAPEGMNAVFPSFNLEIWFTEWKLNCSYQQHYFLYLGKMNKATGKLATLFGSPECTVWHSILFLLTPNPMSMICILKQHYILNYYYHYILSSTLLTSPN